MVSSFDEPFLPLVAPAGDADEAEPQVLTGRLPSYIADHRQRLRDRFLQGGGTALPDYELLELVLFRAIPRQDVKPLARLLLDTFGDFNRVITASPARLQMVKGAGPAVVLELKLVEAAAQRMMRARVMQKPVLSSWDALLDYCHTVMSHRETEQFRVLFLDRKNVLIADEEQARGTVDHVPVYPREIVKRALARNAGAVIFAHNHPSNSVEPSRADEYLTQTLKHALGMVDVRVLDHMVVGADRMTSMAERGLV